jgi:DNA-binding GntR family transcriptional regulator
MQVVSEHQFMSQFSQIRAVSLREQVVEQVRNAIIEGRLRPNDHVTEGELTQQLGVSRTPIREALILLEREALIVSYPHRGRFVRAFTESDVRPLMTMRTTLENFAAELNIGQLTTDDFEQLEDLIDAQRACFEAGDLQRARSVDMAFHRYLIERTGHPVLVRSWQELVAQVAALLYIRGDYDPEYNERRAIEDHQVIVSAYRAGDLAAVQAHNRRINSRVGEECIAAVRWRQAVEADANSLSGSPSIADANQSSNRYASEAIGGAYNP